MSTIRREQLRSPLSASYALTASYAENANASINTGSLLTTASVNSNIITFTKGDGSTFPITVDTGSGGGSNVSGFVTTSSFNTYTASINSFTSSINTFTASYNTGSFTGSFTGSLLGTSSWATNALTASHVNPLNQDLIISKSLYRSFSQYRATDAALPFSNIFNITGSTGVNYGQPNADIQFIFGTNSGLGSGVYTASLYNPNLTPGRELFIINNGIFPILISGSSLKGIQGQINITGQFLLNDGNAIRLIAQTASAAVFSNSWYYEDLSYAVSASFATSASRATSASFATSASRAVSASFATTSSFTLSSSFATTASYAVTASTLNDYASIENINSGSSGKFIRTTELEESKYTTLNIYNYNNFT